MNRLEPTWGAVKARTGREWLKLIGLMPQMSMGCYRFRNAQTTVN